MGDDTADDGPPTPVGIKLGSNRTVVVAPGPDGSPETVQTLSCLAVPDNPTSDDARVHYGEVAARRFPGRTAYFLRAGVPPDANRARRTEQFLDALCSDHDLPAGSAAVRPCRRPPTSAASPTSGR